MLRDNTPLEKYAINNHTVWVKREDLCVTNEGPPFSKVRGILEHLKKLKSQEINTVGYTETSISMAGCGVAWLSYKLGMTAVIFDPQYKDPPPTLQKHRKEWNKWGAILEPIPAGRAKVNWYISRKILAQKYGKFSILLPLGLPLEETIQATVKEAENTFKWNKFNSVVVNVGSGTIASGIWKAINNMGLEISVYGIMGRTGNLELKIKSIQQKSRLSSGGFFAPSSKFHMIDPGWEYTERSSTKTPFPCNPYYDKKAWQWLVENINDLKDPILFWNIGS